MIIRLIDADWVSAHIKSYEPADEEWSVTGGTALRLIHNAIDNAPTIDAVPVVRCKDCKKGQLVPDFDGLYSCIGNRKPLHDPDDFCNFGVKREDG